MADDLYYHAEIRKDAATDVNKFICAYPEAKRQIDTDEKQQSKIENYLG